MDKELIEEMEWDLLDEPESDSDSLVAQEDLRKLCAKAAEYKDQIDALEAQVEALKKPYNEVLGFIQSTLELLEIENLSAQGYKFTLKTESSVKTPKTVEEKKAFFDYLESIGLFYEIVSVNSKTLQSTYKSLAEQALKDGVLDFRLPGIPPATEFNVLKVRKEK